MLLRGTVTIQTEGHAKRLSVIHLTHLVHVAMTALTGNPATYVCLMVKENIVRHLGHTHPLDGLAVVMLVVLIHRTPQWLKLRIVLLHVLVTVPAGIRGRHPCTGRLVYGAVAVAAVDPKLVRMQIVVVSNRLIWLITNALCFRGGIVRKSRGEPQYYENQAYRDL